MLQKLIFSSTSYFQVTVNNAQQVLNSAITDSADVATVFYAVSALAALGLTSKLPTIVIARIRL